MDWLLLNGRIDDDGPLVDVAIDGGVIVGVEPAGTTLTQPASQNSRNLHGNVLLPGLIDTHTHLDKTFTTLENKSGTLSEALAVWRRVRPQRTLDEIRHAVEHALTLAIRNGVTALRSHIDISGPESLKMVELLLTLRAEYQDRISLQFVALGYASGPKSSQDALRDALQMGVDFVGGAPALCLDPAAEIDAAIALALTYGKGIDLHIDETEDPTMLTLEYLAEQTLAHGLEGQVIAGHCCSLAFASPERAQQLIEKVVAAQISIVTLPSCNLVLMGRGIEPAPRGNTRVKALLAAGVNVTAASDNVHDPFNPFGNYDLLQIANLNAHLSHMSGQDELYENLSMVTTRAAACMGLPNKGIAVGQPADLIIVDAKRIIDTILTPPTRLATFKRGRLLVETTISRQWHVQ